MRKRYGMLFDISFKKECAVCKKEFVTRRSERVLCPTCIKKGTT